MGMRASSFGLPCLKCTHAEVCTVKVAEEYELALQTQMIEFLGV